MLLQILFDAIQVLKPNAMYICTVHAHHLQVFTIKTQTETNYLLSSVPLIHTVVFVRYQEVHFLYRIEMRERESGRDAYCEFSIWFYKDESI